MNNNVLLTLRNFIRNNRLKVISLSLIAIIFSLLIIEAIHLLSFPDDNSSTGSKNRDNTSASRSKSSDEKNAREKQGKNQRSPFDNGEFPKDSQNDGLMEPEDSISPEMENNLKNSMPDIEIDLSRRQEYPSAPSFGSGDSYSVKTGQKPKHTPLMEVAGIVGSSFFRISTTETYDDDKWKIPEDAYHTIYKKPPDLDVDSVKVKPFNPAKGFIPVACNSTGVRFPTPFIISFPYMNMYYTDKEFSDYYEMYCNIPAPGEQKLRNANVKNTEGYSISGADDIYTLARKITEGVSEPYDKIKLIENYLKNNYKLEEPENYTVPEGNALNDFLFYSKKGSQLDFISSFVWLLWCSDISARMSIGYKVDPVSNYQIVYADQLCVFPEINFEEYGWIPFDVFESQLYSPPTQTTIEITKVDTVVKKGMNFKVEGTVKDESGAKVNGIPALIYLKKDKDEGCLAYAQGEVIEGAFTIECILDGQMDVGNYNVVAHAVENDIYKGSWSDPEIRVTADTKITLNKTRTVLAGKDFRIQGKIVEELTDMPVREGNMEYIFDKGITIQKQVKTELNEKGDFTDVVRLSLEKGIKPDRNYIFAYLYKAAFTAQYQGSEFYLSSGKSGEISVLVILWQRILMTIISIILPIVFIIVFYKLLNSRKMKVSLETDLGRVVISNSSDVSNENCLSDEKAESDLPYISFPQISNEMPNIWGLDESLTIRFSRENGSYEEISVCFDRKGSKRITLFSEDRKTARNQYVKIVSYREEIIDLGKKMFRNIHERFHAVDFMRMTPREIIEGIPRDMKFSIIGELEKNIRIFEKATYSLKLISRKDFEVYYKSLILVENWLEEVGS